MAAGAVAGVKTGLLPGERRLTELIEGCGPDGQPPSGATGPTEEATFFSPARGRDVRTAASWPPGHEPGSQLPVCLVLHGRGGQAADLTGALAMPAYLAAATRAGVPPFALAAADGGDTYWHRRANGDDPAAMLLDELLPRLADQGLRTSRIGVLGWSMGGYGALLLARRHPDVIAAAVASSPATWQSFTSSEQGQHALNDDPSHPLGGPRGIAAFDSAEDFDEHRILDVGPAPAVAYRIDCGHADAFYDAAHRLTDQLHPAELSFTEGCHTAGYWRRVLPAQLSFVGRTLTA